MTVLRHPNRRERWPAAILTAARDWLLDCEWTDADEDEIEDLTPGAVMAGIARTYDGGVRQFIADGEPTPCDYCGTAEALHDFPWDNIGTCLEFQRAGIVTFRGEIVGTA